MGNIINKKSEIIFNFWELLYQEPPKIFEFTEFSIKWIKGRTPYDVTENPRHDDEIDLDGRKINTMGYLIDEGENIVDQFGKIVFRKAILNERYGQDAQVPDVFLKKGLIRKPYEEQNQDRLAMKQFSSTVQGYLKSGDSSHLT